MVTKKGLSFTEEAALRLRVAEALDGLKPPFTSEMKMTCVARHPTNPECYVVVTEDDVAAVSRLLVPTGDLLIACDEVATFLEFTAKALESNGFMLGAERHNEQAAKLRSVAAKVKGGAA